MTTTTRRLRVLAVLALLGSAVAVHAQIFPVLQGDPVDGFGRAWPILPGVPLITANDDGDFNPPVIDPNTIGDVDLVVRAGHLTPGVTMPPPVLVPPSAAAGGSRFPGGSDIPFTVIASDGDPTVPGGHPLLGPELDGVPVVVFAFADLDRDGVVGPTDADSAGAADNARELQESEFPVGVRVAYFLGGVAQGVVAADVGAPASSGGLPVVLTAASYVGQFSLDFFLGTVPDGPGIATLLPFFPRLDPDRVIDTDGSAGPALPNGRLGVEFESEFEAPVNDPLLGTPFALPTDGSSVTIDRALVGGGRVSRVRFVQPSSPVGLTGHEPRLPLRPGAADSLFDPLTDVTLVDDGPGSAVDVRLVPVDRLDNVTDAAPPVTIELIASSGIAITSPDVDGDPSRESVAFGDGTGILATIDDSGAGNDSGPQGTLDVELDGVRVDRLFVHFTPGPPDGMAPFIYAVGLLGGSQGISLDCPTPMTLIASVHDPEGDASGVTAVVSQDDVELARLELSPAPPPYDPETWTASFPPAASFHVGRVVVTITARDAQGHLSEAVEIETFAADAVMPFITDVSVTPSPLPASRRTRVTVSARVLDDCGVRRVAARVQRGGRFKRLVRLNDRGKKGDAAAGDGVFTGMRQLRVPDATSLVIEITARSRQGQTDTQQVTVPVAP
jgi:hypothetical protein